MRMPATALLVAALTVSAAAAPPAFDPAGKGGELSGPSVLTLRKLGRDRSTTSAALRMGPSALSADSPGGFRLSGPYAQSGPGGRTLGVSHDQGSSSSLLSMLAARAAALHARRRGGAASFGVTVLKRQTRVRANRRRTKVTLIDVVKLAATSPELGRTFRGSYRARLRGTLGETPLPACAAPDDPTALELNALGVSTCPSPRVDDEGDALPDGYTPLGAMRSFDTREILFAGLDATFPDQTTDTVAVFELTPDLPPPGEPVDSYTPRLLHAPSGADVAWASDDGVAPQTRRAAAAADADGDGLEEIVVVHLSGNDVRLRTIDDARGDFAPSDAVVASQAGVRDVSAVGGDFDGDGRSEVAVALALDESVRLLLLSFDGTRWRVAETKTVAQRLPGSILFTALATGNLDHDPGDELVLVVNERLGSEANPEGGVAHFVAYDDAGSGFAEIASGPVRGDDGLTLHTAVVADVSLGDIDGDGRKEVVFAGLTSYPAVFSGSNCTPAGHLLLALDDAKHGLAPLAATHFEYTFPGCGNAGADVWRLRWVHAGTPDLDGDGAAEIQANHFFFDDFRSAPPWTPLDGIPPERIFGGNGTLLFDRSTSAVAAADVTGDGREDVLFFHQNAVPRLSVWADDAVVGFGEVTQSGGALPIPVELANFQNPRSPILLPVNVAPDGPVLRYSPGEYRFVLTEPIVVAALAAPPCWTGVGQVTDACRTSYGTSQTTTGGVDGTVRVFARATVGVSADFAGFGGEAKASIGAAASRSAARAYELEQSVVFTTGPLEDGVVFTTVPVDQYIYVVQSHPIPELIGESVVVNLPRTPITLIAERTFYNRTIREGGFQIDRNVFIHTPGDPRSYPTRQDKDALIRPVDAVGAALDALLEELGLSSDLVGRLLGGGFASRLVSVGQGGGETTAALRFSETDEYRAGAEISFELEASVTGGGVLVGGAVGGSVEAGLSWGSGSATVYSGTVGSLPADRFASNQYSFGVFSYVYNAGMRSSRQFEVVNYWVE